MSVSVVNKEASPSSNLRTASKQITRSSTWTARKCAATSSPFPSRRTTAKPLPRCIVCTSRIAAARAAVRAAATTATTAATAATIAADLSRVARDRRRTTVAATTATTGTLRESGTTAVRTAVTINDVMIGLLSQTRAMHNALRVGEVGEGALVGEHGVDRSGGDGGHDAGELGIDLLGGHLVLDGGPVGRRDLLAVELLPVDVLEPGVVFDLVGGVVAEALGGLFLEQSADQIVRLSHRQTAVAPRET